MLAQVRYLQIPVDDSGIVFDSRLFLEQKLDEYYSMHTLVVLEYAYQLLASTLLASMCIVVASMHVHSIIIIIIFTVRTPDAGGKAVSVAVSTVCLIQKCWATNLQNHKMNGSLVDI